jgi:hypothetical protein
MGHPIHKHMGGMKSAERYDAKEAYNKDLSNKARMHYLENDIADHKGMSRYNSSQGDSPAEVTKKGQAQILASDANPGFKKAIAAASPVDNVSYGDKSGKTGYIGGMSRHESVKKERKDLNTINPVDDKAGMSRYKYKK